MRKKFDSRMNRFEDWFNKYGLNKSEREVSDYFRHNRSNIWYVLLSAVRRAYNRGYKEGLEKGKFESRYQKVKNPAVSKKSIAF